MSYLLRVVVMKPLQYYYCFYCHDHHHQARARLMHKVGINVRTTLRTRRPRSEKAHTIAIKSALRMSFIVRTFYDAFFVFRPSPSGNLSAPGGRELLTICCHNYSWGWRAPFHERRSYVMPLATNIYTSTAQLFTSTGATISIVFTGVRCLSYDAHFAN